MPGILLNTCHIKGEKKLSVLTIHIAQLHFSRYCTNRKSLIGISNISSSMPNNSSVLSVPAYPHVICPKRLVLQGRASRIIIPLYSNPHPAAIANLLAAWIRNPVL